MVWDYAKFKINGGLKKGSGESQLTKNITGNPISCLKINPKCVNVKDPSFFG